MPGYLKRIAPIICLILGGFSNTYGIGLGEADLRSRLGSPLDLSIPLHHLGDLSGQDIRIALSALNDDVSGHPLDSMVGSKFQIDFDSETNSVRLRSDEAVMEPYLAFTLSVRWPRGYLQREYTVLLDLPAVHKPAQREIVVSLPASKTQKPTVAGKQKIVETPEKTASQESPTNAAFARSEPAPVRPAATDTRRYDKFDDGTYRVVRGDSLWRLASRLSEQRRGDHGQWMASVYQTNPEAFIGGRPDILKEAYLLDIPAQCSDVRLALRSDGKTFDLIDGRGATVAAGAPTPEPASGDTNAQEAVANTTREESAEFSSGEVAANTSSPAPDEPEAEDAPVYRYDGKDFVSDPYAGEHAGQAPHKDGTETYADNNTDTTRDLSPLELYSLEEQARIIDPQQTTANPADSIETPSPVAEAEGKRVELLEKQLDQALALIDKQNQQARLFGSQSSLVDSVSPATSELTNPAYLFRAMGWLALGMSMVMGFLMYRDRGGPKMFVLPRNRRRRDFASMLERNTK